LTQYLVSGEQIEGSYTVNEQKLKDGLGQLQLTNYKLIFRKNATRIEECIYYMVPYGLIQKVLEYQSSLEKNDCYIAITCKDERVFKFRFEKAPHAFDNTARIIKRYALKPDLKSLFCMLRASEQKIISPSLTIDWPRIA